MKKTKLTVKDRIDTLLRGRKRGLTPTEIGVKLGYLKGVASAAVGPALRQLVLAGVIKRVENGRRVEYCGV